MRHRHIMEMRSEMKYIESLREGERINEIYLCKVKQSALTKAGKPYDNLILQDKTGTLDAKIWEPGSVGIDEFDSLDYIAVMGDITSFQGNLQLNVKRVRKVQEGEYDPKDYLPVSKKDIDGMYTELLGLIASVKHPYLRKLLESFFVEDKDFEKRFKFHSAAKSVHHGFVGGLLEHTLSVTKNCDYFAATYPILNRDLIVSAAIFHDIGKPVVRSTGEDGVDHFFGHADVSAQMACDILKRLKFDNETLNTVEKLITYHDFRPHPNERSVRRFLNKVGKDLFPLVMKVQRADVAAQSDYQRSEKEERIREVEALAEKIFAEKQCFCLKDMAVTGRDLIADGMKPGKDLGAVLSELLGEVLRDPSHNTKEYLLEYSRTLRRS